MLETSNTNIKIVRLQSGEDIIANYFSDEENGVVLLDNPMHLVFKRLPTGKSVMMIFPWMPIEIVKETNALIYDSDILTTFEPKEELIRYYASIVEQSYELSDDTMLTNAIEELEDEDYDEENESSEEQELEVDELLEIIQERKKNSLH